MDWKEECLKYVAERDELKVKLQAQADLAAGLQGRLEVAEMMLAQVEGRFMIDGSSVDAETAQNYFLGLLNNDILVSDLHHEAAELRAKTELVDQASEILNYTETRGADETLGEIKIYVGTYKEYLQNAARAWMARYDALNHQPHHEGGEG